MYLGKLTAHRSDIQSYLIFIVRDQSRCDYIFQCSDLTRQAYNRWPDSAPFDDGQSVGTMDLTSTSALIVHTEVLPNRRCRCPPVRGVVPLEFPLDYWLQSGYDVT